MRRRPRSAHHHLDVADALPGDLQRVQERGAGDDGRAVLVVVEDRDVQRLLQPPLHLEALRRLDVLQVDAAERRRHGGDGGHHLVHGVGVQLDVEHVDVGEPLEEDPPCLP